MVECVICDILEGKVPAKKIYEDEDIMAFLDVNGATKGHTFIAPKKHYPIFEQVPDHIVAQIFEVSNKVSTALFESLNVQGTNVFVANGVTAGQSVAHFLINVIPRTEGDGVNLQWQPRQLSEEEMSTVEIKVKEWTQHLGGFGKEEQGVEKVEGEVKKIASDEENYLWRSVNKRIS